MKLFNSTLINKITQFIIVFFSIILFSFSCIDGKCIESTACCWYDSCGKCNGDNLNINNYGRCDCEIDGDVYADCSGECGGNKSLDCNYECNGDAVIQTYWIDNDGDGLGYGTNMEYCSALVPNNWVLNDDDVDDNCPSCSDCLGIPNGDAQLDMCGTCDSDSSNDCVQDCVGVWGGTTNYIDNGCNLPSGVIYLSNDGKILYNSSMKIYNFEFIIHGTGGTFSGTMNGGDAGELGYIVNGIFENDRGFVVSGYNTGNLIEPGCGVLTEMDLNFSALYLSDLLFDSLLIFEYYNCNN